MICQIFKTTFELNHNKNRVLLSLQKGPNVYADPKQKPSHMQPLMEPYNFHFNDWELVAWNFNPENFNHWKYFRRHILSPFQTLSQVYFLNELDYDWMPEDAKKRLETSYAVFKLLDEEGNIVDTRPFLEAYHKELHEQMENRRYHSNNAPTRHPHTRNQVRNQLLPEDVSYAKAMGCTIKYRNRSKILPTSWDDIPIHTSRCWKNCTRQRRQYG